MAQLEVAFRNHLKEGDHLEYQEGKETSYQVQRFYFGGLFGMKLVLCSTRAIRTEVKSLNLSHILQMIL